MLNEIFARRFLELETSYSKLKFESTNSYSSPHVANGQWRQWATSAQSLIAAVFGMSSPHHENFVSEYNECSGGEYSLGALNAVFKSAKEDFEGGYVFSPDLMISGEVFGDFVVLAKQSLTAGHKDVAAVLACAALEDALKRFANHNKIDVTDKTMAEVVNALKAQGLVTGVQKSLLEAMPRVRNAAMHGDWAKISEPDVSSVIGFVEQFLLTKFAGS